MITLIPLTTLCGGVRRGHREQRDESESEEESDSSEWDSQESENSEEEEAVGVMCEKEWVRIALCEVEEDSKVWREVVIFGKKLAKNPSESVCLWFGDGEYEGLPLGSYRFDQDQGKLFDEDGEQIMIRGVCGVHDTEFVVTM